MKTIAATMLLTWMARCVSAATPVVSNVALAQDPATRLVTVTYDLGGADAIITLDVLTNGTSVGDANLTVLSGDVNRLVAQGTGKKIVWNPDAAVAPYAADATAAVSAWTESNPPDYLAVNLSVANDLRYYTSTNALPYGGLANDCYRKDILLMRRIPARNVTWWMGQRTTSELGGTKYRARETRHQVTLTNDYWMGVFELTYGQWHHLMGGYPSGTFSNVWHRETRPVETVSYQTLRGVATYANWPASPEVDDDCIIGRLRGHSGIAAMDLPTDAQWEYACRAGTAEALYSGHDLSQTSNDPQASLLARHSNNGGATKQRDSCDTTAGTAKVGSYLPNAWGLYDMLGNVYEWCLDRCESTAAIGDDDAIDPVGPATGDYRVRHGGSWNGDCQYLRAAYRGCSKATESAASTLMTVGFRVAARIPNEEEEEP